MLRIGPVIITLDELTHFIGSADTYYYRHIIVPSAARLSLQVPHFKSFCIDFIFEHNPHRYLVGLL